MSKCEFSNDGMHECKHCDTRWSVEWQELRPDNMPPTGKPIYVGYRKGYQEWHSSAMVITPYVTYEVLRWNYFVTHWILVPDFMIFGPTDDSE